MIEKTEKERLLNEYLEMMDIRCCRFIAKEGYHFYDTTPIKKGDLDNRFSKSFNPSQTQVLRYLSYLSYADKKMLDEAARISAKNRELSYVVTAGHELRDMIEKLVFQGLVCKRQYVKDGQTGGRSKVDQEFYFLTDRGITLFKIRTESCESIEKNLIERKEPKAVMQWLTAGNVLLKVKEMCQGREVQFARKVKLPNPWGRHAIYGYVEDENMVAVFEPILYKQVTGNPDKAAKRADFVKAFFKEFGNGREKILVFVVQDRTDIDSIRSGYGDAISDSDRIFITHENLVYNNPGKDVGIAPFIRISKDSEEELEVANPPFVLRNEIYTGKPIEKTHYENRKVDPIYDPESGGVII